MRGRHANLRLPRRQVDFVARLGGDEFVVLLNGPERCRPTKHEATGARRGPHAAFRHRPAVSLAEDTFQTTASIGAVLLSDADHDVDDVLKRADLAMYEAKGAGRGTLRFFEEAMQTAAADRLALTSELRRARTRKAAYAPLSADRRASGRCIVAEALLRWHHPTRGLISAGEFIALAERSGLIRSIDNWVLRAACATLKEWESDPLTRELQLAGERQRARAEPAWNSPKIVEDRAGRIRRTGRTVSRWSSPNT